MRIRVNLFLIVALVGLFACSSSKKASENVPPPPTWVQSKPSIPGYYVGVGRAPKVGDVNSYRQSSKNNALADMSSEISVSISTSSVLHQFESSLRFSDDFTSTIQAESQKDLEGFELVDTYEDNTSVWSYYRLSEVTWADIQAKKRDAAVTSGIDLFERGNSSKNSGDVKSAFISYIKALVSMKAYLGEPLQTTYNGKSILLGNELFDAINGLVNSIKITANQQSLLVKAGDGLPADKLQFTATTGGNPVKQFPLLFSFTAKPLRNATVLTDELGKAGYALDNITSAKGVETFTAEVDWSSMASEATTENYFRRLSEKFNQSPAYISIEVIKPKVFVNSVEINQGNILADRPLASKLISLLNGDGIDLASDARSADFLLEVQAETVQRNQSGNLVYAEVVGTLQLKDSKGNVLLSQSLAGTTAANLNSTSAGADAMKRQADKLGGYLWTQIHDKIVKR
jgi:hypothetical protein